jgi:alpha-tubulin suppressor-like RCC1 family protein
MTVRAVRGAFGARVVGATVAGAVVVAIAGLLGVPAASVGAASGTQGNLWGWGCATLDGDGERECVATPQALEFEGVGEVVDVAAGGLNQSAFANTYGLALTSQGTVWAWGDNRHGQLGDATTQARAEPVRVEGLSDVGVVAVEAGGRHSLALTADGQVWAWGGDDNRQLGNSAETETRQTTLQGVPISSTRYRSTPLPVTGLDDVEAIAAGGSHNLALTADGTVWGWGANNRGQLGNGQPTGGQEEPTAVVDPADGGAFGDVEALAAGASHSLALRRDGSVWAWGYNNHGELGNGVSTTQNLLVDGQPVPTQVIDPAVGDPQRPFTGVSDIAAGGNFSLALKDGHAWGWGSSYDDTPVRIEAVPGRVTDMAAGSDFGVLRRADGSLWATAGSNSHGQLGDGTTQRRTEPVRVKAIDSVADLSAADRHVLAITAD